MTTHERMSPTVKLDAQQRVTAEQPKKPTEPIWCDVFEDDARRAKLGMGTVAEATAARHERIAALVRAIPADKHDKVNSLAKACAGASLPLEPLLSVVFGSKVSAPDPLPTPTLKPPAYDRWFTEEERAALRAIFPKPKRKDGWDFVEFLDQQVWKESTGASWYEIDGDKSSLIAAYKRFAQSGHYAKLAEYAAGEPVAHDQRRLTHFRAIARAGVEYQTRLARKAEAREKKAAELDKARRAARRNPKA